MFGTQHCGLLSSMPSCLSICLIMSVCMSVCNSVLPSNMSICLFVCPSAYHAYLFVSSSVCHADINGVRHRFVKTAEIHTNLRLEQDTWRLVERLYADRLTSLEYGDESMAMDDSVSVAALVTLPACLKKFCFKFDTYPATCLETLHFFALLSITDCKNCNLVNINWMFDF